MIGKTHPSSSKRNGSAYVLALFILVIFTCLSVGIAAKTRSQLTSSDNFRHTQSARLAAESGMAFLINRLSAVNIPAGASGEGLISLMGDELIEMLEGSGNLPSGSLQVTSESIVIPAIALQNGQFSAVITSGGSSADYLLTVTGTRGQAVRRMCIGLDLQQRRSPVFDYGIASRGRIYVSGSAEIIGLNDASEASVLSTRQEPVAIEAGGHATIDGDLYVTSNDPDSFTFTGNGFTIGGSSDIEDILLNHVHIGVDDPGFPPIDTTIFSGLAPNVIDENTDLSVVNNARIVAGSTVAFPNTTINGVLYIEAPSTVTFLAGTTVNGIIVTEDGASSNLEDCQIEFRGHVSVPGVDALSNDPEWSVIKTLGGTAILAPGFGVTFKGATNSINGVIAADQLSFIGNSNIAGDLTGAILGLKDLQMTLQGNSSITINRLGDDDMPAGFVHSLRLAPNPSTYCELSN